MRRATLVGIAMLLVSGCAAPETASEAPRIDFWQALAEADAVAGEIGATPSLAVVALAGASLVGDSSEAWQFTYLQEEGRVLVQVDENGTSFTTHKASDFLAPINRSQLMGPGDAFAALAATAPEFAAHWQPTHGLQLKHEFSATWKFRQPNPAVDFEPHAVDPDGCAATLSAYATMHVPVATTRHTATLAPGLDGEHSWQVPCGLSPVRMEFQTLGMPVTVTFASASHNETRTITQSGTLDLWPAAGEARVHVVSEGASRYEGFYTYARPTGL